MGLLFAAQINSCPQDARQARTCRSIHVRRKLGLVKEYCSQHDPIQPSLRYAIDWLRSELCPDLRSVLAVKLSSARNVCHGRFAAGSGPGIPDLRMSAIDEFHEGRVR
jgi:hypothetical protein